MLCAGSSGPRPANPTVIKECLVHEGLEVSAESTRRRNLRDAACRRVRRAEGPRVAKQRRRAVLCVRRTRLRGGSGDRRVHVDDEDDSRSGFGGERKHCGCQRQLKM